MGGDMSSPIFDATFATGRFRYEEPMTTDPTTSPSPPQDVRGALADLVKWKDYKDEHGADATYELGKERAWRNARAALAQSDLKPKRLVECPICKGSGFSGQGSGYDDVCGECGGQKYLSEAQSDAEPPGHTDLMVSPESLDAYMEANPLPTGASAGLIEAAEIVKDWSRACVKDSEANLLDKLEKELRTRASDRSGK
jgi:hypothetical protein